MTLRWYESAFSEHFKLCLTPLNHQELQKRAHACENMGYLTAWDASNKLYKRGWSDYPWCAGPRGHSRAQAHVVLSWWKEVDGRDPSSLPAVCLRLLCAGTPLGDYTVPPRSKKPILKQSQRQTLTLETGTRLLTPGSPSELSSSLGGECLNQCIPARGQKVCKFSFSSCYFFHLYTHTHYNYSFLLTLLLFQDIWKRPCAVHTNGKTKYCN